MMLAGLQSSFFSVLLFNWAIRHFGAAKASHNGLWNRQIIKTGVVNPNNSTSARSPPATTLSNGQGNNLAIVNASIHNMTNGTQTRVAPKLVFAHFIGGLTYDYNRQHWLNDISLAASHGIDAFALNVGAPESWQVNQMLMAYDVATQVKVKSGNTFKMFLSLDMSVIQTADQVSTWVSNFSQKDSQLLVDGKVFISTFSGESTLFGASNLTAGWTAAVKTPLAALNPPMEAMFVPVWSSLDPNTAVSSNPVVDGIMTWKSWPTATEAMSTMEDLKFQADAIKNSKYYMAGVSPCFFTHYSEKNFIFRSDDNLYLNRWKQLITMPIQPDFIQILSWNDYGESHYIGPMSGKPPVDTTWMEGFDHEAWLDMSDYFIQWYKTGSPPPITEDKVYYYYRPHSVTTTASSDPLELPTNAPTTTDAIYLAAFLTSDSKAKKLKVSIGNTTTVFTQFNLSSISTFSLPWNGASGEVQVTLLDGSDKSLLASKAPISIKNSIQKYNFNYASEVLMKGGLKRGSKSSAKSGSSNISTLLNPWTSLLVMSIALLSNLC